MSKGSKNFERRRQEQQRKKDNSASNIARILDEERKAFQAQQRAFMAPAMTKVAQKYMQDLEKYKRLLLQGGAAALPQGVNAAVSSDGNINIQYDTRVVIGDQNSNQFYVWTPQQHPATVPQPSVDDARPTPQMDCPYCAQGKVLTEWSNHCINATQYMRLHGIRRAIIAAWLFHHWHVNINEVSDIMPVMAYEIGHHERKEYWVRLVEHTSGRLINKLCETTEIVPWATGDVTH